MADTTVTPKPTSRRLAAVLHDRSFRYFFLGQSVSAVGDSLVPVATAFAVLRISGSVTLLGLVLAVLWASRLAAAPIAGQLADRIDRVRVAVGSDLVRCVVQAVLAVVFLRGDATIWELAVGAGVYGAASSFFGPAAMGLVAETVDDEKRQQANALVAISQNIASVLGPGLSGVLASAGGFGIAYALDSGSFLASAGFLVLLGSTRSAGFRAARPGLADGPDPEPDRARNDFSGGIFKREFGRFREGIAEVNKHPWMWFSFTASAVTNVSTSAFFVLGPAVAENRLGGATTWGLVGMSASVGGLLGGVVGSRWHPRRPLVTGYLLMGLLIPAQLAALAQGPAIVLIMAAAAAITSMVFGTVLLDTAIQSQVPEATIARVDSLDTLVSTLPMPLGLLAAGPVASLVGVPQLLIGLAVCTALANLAVLLSHSGRTYLRFPATEAPAEGA